MGRLVILNGVSSAGKTTLARSLQASAPDVWLHVRLDDFIAMLPDAREAEAEWFPVTYRAMDGEDLPAIGSGPSGEVLLSAMRRFAASLVKSGLNVIVDDVCEASAIADYRALAAGTRALVVRVHAPLDVIQQRENARGDRLIGLAREQSARIHRGIDYDLELDTGELSARECADRILELLGS